MKRAVGRREVAKRGYMFRLKEKKVRLVARRRRRSGGRCRIRGIVWGVWNDLFCGGWKEGSGRKGGGSIGTTTG